MKKALALLLTLVMLLSCTSFAMADDVLEIEFWYALGGSIGTLIENTIQGFNETVGAEKGIKVVGSYQGGYTDTMAKAMNAVVAGNNPALVMLECSTGVSSMYAEGALVELDEMLAQSESLKEEDFVDILMYHSKRDGKLVAIPYMRSCAVYYYNKTLFDELGLTAPTTIEELEQVGAAITAAYPDVYGYEAECMGGNQWVVYNEVAQKGSNFFSEDGLTMPCLEDGSLLEIMQDWRRWVDEGWCSVPAITSTSSAVKENFYQGRVASFIYSCGGMAGILSAVEGLETPFEVGVAYVPTYGISCCPIGGNEIGILSANSDEVIKASWTFIEYLCSADVAAATAAGTGYVPALKTCVESDILKELWAEKPVYEVGFNQLMDCQAVTNLSDYMTDMLTPLTEACSLLIQDQSITAEEGLQIILDEAAIILP